MILEQALYGFPHPAVVEHHRRPRRPADHWIGQRDQPPHPVEQLQLQRGLLVCRTPTNWFDKTALTMPTNYTYGNSGADILREGNFKSLDF